MKTENWIHGWLKSIWKKKEVPDYRREKNWSFERIYKLGRRSYHGFPADGGVRMQCEKLAVKISKRIQLTEHDIYYLERLEEKPITKDEQYSNEHDIRDESNHLGFDDGGEG